MTSLEERIQASGKQHFSALKSSQHLDSRLFPLKEKKSSLLWVWMTSSFATLLAIIGFSSILLATTQPPRAFDSPYPTLTRLNASGSFPVNMYKQSSLMYQTLQDGVDHLLDMTAADVFDEPINQIFSPLSMYMSLLMLLEASEHETFAEFQSLLLPPTSTSIRRQQAEHMILSSARLSLTQLQERARSKMASGMFLKTGSHVKQAYLDVLSTHYDTSVFTTDFDDLTKVDIAKWINDQTFDALAAQPEDFSFHDQTEFLLYHTLMLQANWKQPFGILPTYESYFAVEGGNFASTLMMQKMVANTQLLETDTATIWLDETYADYKVGFMLPHGGVPLSTLIQSFHIGDILQAINARPQQNIHAHIPQFSIRNHLDLAPILRPHLLTAFDGSTANFSQAMPGLVLQAIRQDVQLELSEVGLKAAAVTSADMAATSMPELATRSFILNRSFIMFVINENGLLQFIGTIYHP